MAGKIDINLSAKQTVVNHISGHHKEIYYINEIKRLCCIARFNFIAKELAKYKTTLKSFWWLISMNLKFNQKYDNNIATNSKNTALSVITF